MRMIEFKGYQLHDQLNPKLWDGTSLRPDVKLKLLKTAELFLEFLDIQVPVIDLQITGGQVTYHYTDHSDLDLHLIIDYDQIDCDQEIEELLDTKRLLFKQQHDINIKGIPVEPGTEDIKRPTVSSAYSLKTDSWIREPKNQSSRIDQETIEKQSQYWVKIFRSVLDENDPETAKKLLKIIRKYRKIGLKRTGEYGVENLVYKGLRNQGLIKQLERAVLSSQDRDLSISN
jgi:hypothetical protein